MLAIMEKYGWDYQTYERQPAWVIDLIFEKMKLEGTIARAKASTPTKT